MPGAEFIRDIKAQAREFAAEVLSTEELFAKEAVEIAEFENAQAEETTAHLIEFFEDTVNPLVGNYASKEKSIKEHRIQKAAEVTKPEVKQKVIPEREAKDSASKFEKRNPELRAQSLINLLKKAQDCKTKEDLLKLLEEYYPDPLLAD